MNCLISGCIALICFVFGSISLSQAGKITCGHASEDLDVSPARVITFAEDSSFIERVKPHSISIHAGAATPHAVRSRSCWGCGPCGHCADKRVRVDPRDNPHRIHAFLMTRFGDRWFRGSATLVSPNSLATAGHCLLQNGVHASEITIEFGLQVQKTKGCFSCQRRLVSTTTARTKKPLYTIHPDFIEDEQSPYDLAIITFNQDVEIRHGDDEFQYGSQSFEIGTRYGYAALGNYDEADLLRSSINITGYPNTVRCARDTCDMYSMAGIVERVATNTLLYRTDTSTGQSGAGICRIQDDQSVELVGIHAGEYARGYNGGPVLNESVIRCFSDHLRLHDSAWHRTSGLP